MSKTIKIKSNDIKNKSLSYTLTIDKLKLEMTLKKEIINNEKLSLYVRKDLIGKVIGKDGKVINFIKQQLKEVYNVNNVRLVVKPLMVDINKTANVVDELFKTHIDDKNKLLKSNFINDEKIYICSSHGIKCDELSMFWSWETVEIDKNIRNIVCDKESIIYYSTTGEHRLMVDVDQSTFVLTKESIIRFLSRSEDYIPMIPELTNVNNRIMLYNDGLVKFEKLIEFSDEYKNYPEDKNNELKRAYYRSIGSSIYYYWGIFYCCVDNNDAEKYDYFKSVKQLKENGGTSE